MLSIRTARPRCCSQKLQRPRVKLPANRAIPLRRDSVSPAPSSAGIGVHARHPEPTNSEPPSTEQALLFEERGVDLYILETCSYNRRDLRGHRRHFFLLRPAHRCPTHYSQEASIFGTFRPAACGRRAEKQNCKSVGANCTLGPNLCSHSSGARWRERFAHHGMPTPVSQARMRPHRHPNPRRYFAVVAAKPPRSPRIPRLLRHDPAPIRAMGRSPEVCAR